MFKRVFKFLAVAAMAVGLAACGKQVEIPSAYVGKIMTKHGYEDGFKQTSKFRLDFCGFPGQVCEEVVLLSVADSAVTEEMTLFMPKDRLNMTFSLQATLTLREDKYDEMYARITPQHENGLRWIPTSTIYKTYAKQIILAEAREFLSQYQINDIASNLESVNQQLSAKLAKSIQEKTPFSVRFIGLSNLQYPKIIVESQENAAKRAEMIRTEQAQLELSKTQLERTLQETRMQRKVDVEKAEADAQVNRILGESITPQYVKYQELEIMKKVAESDNKVFLPMKMLDTIAGQMQVR